MNTNQKKLLMWVVGLIVVLSYFGPGVMESVRRTVAGRQGKVAPVASLPRPAPIKDTGTTAVPSASPQATAEAEANAVAEKLVGNWVGSAVLTDRGVCNLKLELTRSGKLGEFSGFSNLACAPTVPMLIAQGGKHRSQGDLVDAATRAMYPSSAILAGVVENNAISFRAKKNIGVGQTHDGCAMTSFTVTPFGTNQIAAEWQEEKEAFCNGGQMVMKKVGQ
jgi:hypothetical protein